MPDPLPWHLVEKKIHQEIEWLDKNIEETKFSNRGAYDHPITCRRCIMREIAILIVSGYVKVREICSTSLWGSQGAVSSNTLFSNTLLKKHGKDWHFSTMNKIATYFLSQGYIVEPEPKLNYGTADLFIARENERPMFAEVGTVLLYKLLYNLSTMVGTDILVVPRDNFLIEFSVLASGLKK